MVLRERPYEPQIAAQYLRDIAFQCDVRMTKGIDPHVNYIQCVSGNLSVRLDPHIVTVESHQKDGATVRAVCLVSGQLAVDKSESNIGGTIRGKSVVFSDKKGTGQCSVTREA